MATLELSNYLPVNLPSLDEAEMRLSATTTLHSELIETTLNGLRWSDLSSFDDDLPTEAIAEPMEYLGLRRLLIPNQNHRALFRVMVPAGPADALRPSERARTQAGMRAAAGSMVAAGAQTACCK